MRSSTISKSSLSGKGKVLQNCHSLAKIAFRSLVSLKEINVIFNTTKCMCHNSKMCFPIRNMVLSFLHKCNARSSTHAYAQCSFQAFHTP